MFIVNPFRYVVADGYAPAYAMQFDGSTDYISWIPTQAGNRRTWTFSAWVKRSEIGNSENNRIFNAGTSAVEYLIFGSGSSAGSDQLELTSVDGAGNECIKTTAVYRDPSAWMHIVVAVDTTNATGGNRARLFVNGTEVTAFAIDTNPTQNVESHVNNTVIHALGVNTYNLNSQFFDGYMADVIFLDGIASTDASAFGETDSDTGIWVPKDPTDSDNISDWGGQNSFYLNFADGNNPGKDAKPTAITANPGTYKIDHSLWFDGSADYLTKTYGSDVNRKTFTLSGWFKRTDPGTNSTIWGPESGGDYFNIRYDSTDILYFVNYTSSVNKGTLTTTPKYRDPTAWQHIVMTWDTTPSTPSSDSIYLTVNGVKVTALASSTYPSQNTDANWGKASLPCWIGRNSGGNYFSGYMAELIYIDGQALSADSFGGFDANGIWMPIDPTALTYGTNGFRLDFHDTSALGEDVANNNDFTVEGTMATSQRTTDTPTNTAADNEGNFATFNSLLKTTGTFSNGNLTFLADSQSGFGHSITSTHVMTSGTYYAEFVVNAWSGTNHATIGIATTDFVTSGNYASKWTGANTQSWGYYADGSVYTNNSATSSGYTSYTIGDVIGVKLDATNGAVYFYKDGTVQNSGSAAFSSLTGPFVFSVSNAGGSTHTTITANFGQTSLSHQPGSTSTLGTHNLPAVSIDPRAHFAPVIYEGTGLDRAVRGCFDSTGEAWTPDLVWIKNRDQGDEHKLIDSVRGVTRHLSSDSNNAEAVEIDGLQSFISGGFTLGTGAAGYNDSAESFVAWCWKANGSPSSNSDGTITSSVSANTTAGFSIVSYTGNSTTDATVGHGLSSTPELVIVKNREAAESWATWHKTLDSAKRMDLDSTAAQFSTANYVKGVTADVFQFSSSGGVINNGDDFIAYCWHSVDGFSKFGSYVGNNSTDGPFIYLGFKPAWVMVKRRTVATDNWVIWNSAMDGYNPTEKELNADDPYQESANSPDVDFLSNGFKIRQAGSPNVDTGIYIYAAFAETPFANNNRGR